MKKQVCNFHVPLQISLYERLREEAKRSGMPATELAREAIRRWLEDRRRESLSKEISAFARRLAGSTQDLDEELEDASLRYLRSDLEEST